MRQEFKWTEHQVDKLNKVLKIIEEFKAYIPLTLRQVYYQMVGKGFIDNKVSEYNMLSKLLKWARIDGYIGWDTIEDRVRVLHDGTGFSDKNQFIKQEVANFLEGYRRDIMQTQPVYIEVWIEKDALSSIFSKISRQYGISTIVARGFSSVTFLHDFKERVSEQMGLGKQPIMLYFGDFDPSGVEMLDSMQITLKDELGLDGVEFKRIALLRDDIFQYKLPHNPDALKKSDTRAKKFTQLNGNLAVELDALRPDVLEDKIKKAIEAELDVDAFNEQVNLYNTEIDKLNALKNRVVNLINNEIRND